MENSCLVIADLTAWSLVEGMDRYAMRDVEKQSYE